MYYGYSHDDLCCEYCLKFKDDVCDHKGKSTLLSHYNDARRYG